MNRYTKSIALAILLVAAATLTKAQNASSVCPTFTLLTDKFTDIVQVGFTGIAVGENAENNSEVAVGLTNIFAYSFTDQISLSVGIGYESVSNENSTYLPLSADLRWYLTQNKVTPFLNLNGGYSFNLDAGEGGGDDIFTGLNLGVRIITRSNIGILFAAGLKYEDAIYHYNISDYLAKTYSVRTVTENYFYIPFTFGLEF